jgi:hypothetical protein
MMRTMPFSFEHRALEARMVADGKSFVCYVWEGTKQVSSVPYTIAEDEVRAAEAKGELEQLLAKGLQEVRDAVTSHRLNV